MIHTVIAGQEAPLDLDLLIYRGGFWKADIAWQDASGAAVPAADKVIQLRWERSVLADPSIYPPDLDSSLDPAPPVNTADYLRLSDGQIEIGLTSETTKVLAFSSTRYRMYLLTDGIPELWASGRARMAG